MHMVLIHMEQYGGYAAGTANTKSAETGERRRGTARTWRPTGHVMTALPPAGCLLHPPRRAPSDTPRSACRARHVRLASSLPHPMHAGPARACPGGRRCPTLCPTRCPALRGARTCLPRSSSKVCSRSAHGARSGRNRSHSAPSASATTTRLARLLESALATSSGVVTPRTPGTCAPAAPGLAPRGGPLVHAIMQRRLFLVCVSPPGGGRQRRGRAVHACGAWYRKGAQTS